MKYTYSLTYLLTCLFTNSKEQSNFWEGNRLWADQEISCILWKPMVHDHINKRPPPVPIQSWMICAI
jgi:hypothetical protein